ncbi:MAG: tetratricopeptide repeat protein [Calditerrivibrio sp.]|nr:tetratricopeptide repeat protein [Calditerrivibrio sp.]
MKKLMYIFFVAIAVIINPLYGYNSEIKSIRYKTYTDYTRIVLDLTHNTSFTHTLKTTDHNSIKHAKITLNIPTAKTSKKIKNTIIDDFRVRSITLDTQKGYPVFIIETKDIDQYKIFSLTNPHRIVIDLLSTKTFLTETEKRSTSQDNKTANKSIPNLKIDKTLSDDLLNLAFSIFLQSNDLKNAHKTAKIALEKKPNSLYWHEQFAKVSLWLGLIDDAHSSMLFIFKNKKTHDPQFIKNLRSTAFNVGDYKTITDLIKNDILNGDLSKIDEYVYIETEIMGNIETVLNFLHNLTTGDNPNLRIKAYKEIIKLYYHLNDIPNTKRFFDEYVSHYNIDPEISLIGSTIYFTIRQYDRSLDILKKAYSYATDNDTDYLEQLSDMSEFLKDTKTALKASLRLYNIKKHREVDTQRIISYTDDLNLKKSLLLESWTKYKLPFYAYNYLYLLMKMNLQKEAFDFLERYRNEPSLYNDIPFLLLTINLYNNTKRYGDVKKTYLRLLTLSDSPAIKEAFIWSLIDNKDKDAEQYIRLFRQETETFYTLNLAYSAYFASIQKYNKALYHLSKYMRFKGDTPELLSLYADILQSSGRVEEAENIRFKAYTLFMKLSKTIPEFLLEKEKIVVYLKLSLYYKTPEEFKALLEKYESYLTTEEKKDIHLLYMLKNNKQEHARYLIERFKYAQPWMLLNIALVYDDRDTIQNLLYKHISHLPTRDRVEAARRIGDIMTATQLAFDGLEEEFENYGSVNHEYRSVDSELYKQYRDLISEYQNFLTLETTFGTKGSIDFLNNTLGIKQHLWKTFYTQLKISSTTINPNSNNITNPPNNLTSIQIDLYKQLNERTKLSLTLGYNEFMKAFYSTSIGLDHYLLNKTSIGLSLKHHIPTDETTYMSIGAMKDEVKIDLRHHLSQKQTIYTSFGFSKFYAQDKNDLGASKNLYAEYSFKLREGYPDILWRSFLSYGSYSQKDCTNCIINKLSPYNNTKFLPDDFQEIGIGVIIGDINRYGYTRVFRPFASATLSYSSQTDLNYGLSLGIGGSLFNQDHLSISIGYGTNSKNSKDVTREIKMIYRLWY